MEGGEIAELLQRLGVALGLGLIVGLQRERIGSPMAGFRTFPLVTIFGALCGLLAAEHEGWVLAAGIVAVGGLLFMGNLERREQDRGLTTEVAMLLMFAVGAFLMTGPMTVGVITGGTVAVLL